MLADKVKPEATAPAPKNEAPDTMPPGPPLDLYVSGVILPWTDEKEMIDEARVHADE